MLCSYLQVCGLMLPGPPPNGPSAQASAVSLAGLNNGDPSSAAKVLLTPLDVLLP